MSDSPRTTGPRCGYAGCIEPAQHAFRLYHLSARPVYQVQVCEAHGRTTKAWRAELVRLDDAGDPSHYVEVRHFMVPDPDNPF